MTDRRSVAVLVLHALAAGPALGQTPAPFRTETRLVVLHVTVRDSRDALVSDLDRSAFTVFENGKRQPIVLFRRDDIPVSVGILVDNSGSMRSLRSHVEAAALAFARASNPDDEMFVINFADTPRLDVPFTSDVRALEAGIARVDAIGGTAMRDAIDLAETYLDEHATRDRRALLVITDGNDNTSETTLEHIRTRAEQRDLVIYGVGLLSDDDASKTKRAASRAGPTHGANRRCSPLSGRDRGHRRRRARHRSADSHPVHDRVCAAQPSARRNVSHRSCHGCRRRATVGPHPRRISCDTEAE